MKLPRFRPLLLFLVLSSLILSLSACALSPSAPVPHNTSDINVLTIATADSGGTMYPVGKAIASVLENDTLKFNLSASTGSAMNVKNLLSEEVDLALVSGDTALAAREADSSPAEELYAIAAVFFSQSNWLAPVDTGAVYVHDLTGKRLGVGPENSTTELSAQAAIHAVGLNERDTTLVNCSLGVGTESVNRGELDAIHGFSGPPIGGLGRLAQSRPCRVLKYTPEELDAILCGSPVYLPATLPAGTYPGQLEPVDTFGVKCLLCVNRSMDPELVRSLTAALWDSREELSRSHPALRDCTDPHFLFENLPIPLHPGAQEFYQDMIP